MAIDNTSLIQSIYDSNSGMPQCGSVIYYSNARMTQCRSVIDDSITKMT